LEICLIEILIFSGLFFSNRFSFDESALQSGPIFIFAAYRPTSSQWRTRKMPLDLILRNARIADEPADAPATDIAMMRHETQITRLFAN